MPGEKTIPDLIVEDRDPYYEALRHADKAWADGRLDVSNMEDLMSRLLAKQLVAVHAAVTGKRPSFFFHGAQLLGRMEPLIC